MPDQPEDCPELIPDNRCDPDVPELVPDSGNLIEGVPSNEDLPQNPAPLVNVEPMSTSTADIEPTQLNHDSSEVMPEDAACHDGGVRQLPDYIMDNLLEPLVDPCSPVARVGIQLTADDVLNRRNELFRKAPELIGKFRQLLNTSGPPGCAFDGYRRDDIHNRAVHLDYSSRNVWFIGDVHGDLVALEAALKHIEREGAADPIVFLGDLIDDGVDGYAVLLRLVDLLATDRNRVALLPGNHDIALQKRAAGFRSTVEPSEFADWLNACPEDEVAQELGQLAIAFFQRCPRAFFFQDGLLAAHGGFPHVDLHSDLDLIQLNDERCLADFTWLRAHEKAKHKDPNRNTHGCSFGTEDFRAFRTKAQELGLRVEHMIRGHDHIEERFKVYPAYENRLLTINTLGHRLPREFSFTVKEYTRMPCIARGRSEMLPGVHQLFISPEVIQAIYPDPNESQS